MIVLQEIQKIAELNSKIERLSEVLGEKMDSDGLDWKSAYFVDGCKERNGHLYSNGERLDNDGLVDDLYYRHLCTGYLDDVSFGTLYFKTNVPGQFVAVPFSM